MNPDLDLPAPEAAELLGAVPAQRRQSVVVVDDDDSIRELITCILEVEGYVVRQAADAEVALGLVHESVPDLMTIDIMMPGMDGWELSRVLRDDPATSHVKRMMVSAQPPGENERRVVIEKVHAYLAKPFDFATFVRTVRELLESAAEPGHRGDPDHSTP
jgi:CheY-like chemotaxis protein